MSDQLRETLYFGEDDCRRYLTDEQYESLVALHDKITEGRLNDNLMAVFGVFVPEGHVEYRNIMSLYNQSSTGDRPVILMPTDEWYHPVHELVCRRERGEEYLAESGIVQPSIATLQLMRMRYHPMIQALSNAVRKDTVNAATEIALEANQFVELASRGANSGDPDFAGQTQRYWEAHDEGFDLTMSSLQCARERLLEAGFHLTRITNTIYLHHSRTGMAPASAK
jgi:hypothetical protein